MSLLSWQKITLTRWRPGTTLCHWVCVCVFDWFTLVVALLEITDRCNFYWSLWGDLTSQTSIASWLHSNSRKYYRSELRMISSNGWNATVSPAQLAGHYQKTFECKLIYMLPKPLQSPTEFCIHFPTLNLTCFISLCIISLFQSWRKIDFFCRILPEGGVLYLDSDGCFDKGNNKSLNFTSSGCFPHIQGPFQIKT